MGILAAPNCRPAMFTRMDNTPKHQRRTVRIKKATILPFLRSLFINPAAYFSAGPAAARSGVTPSLLHQQNLTGQDHRIRGCGIAGMIERDHSHEVYTARHKRIVLVLSIPGKRVGAGEVRAVRE